MNFRNVRWPLADFAAHAVPSAPLSSRRSMVYVVVGLLTMSFMRGSGIGFLRQRGGWQEREKSVSYAKWLSERERLTTGATPYPAWRIVVANRYTRTRRMDLDTLRCKLGFCSAIHEAPEWNRAIVQRVHRHEAITTKHR